MPRRELAEGRAAIVEIVRAMGTTARSTFEDLWDPPPIPPDLYEWIASLVADGTLEERRAEDGNALYVLAPEPPGGERILIDPEAIDRAIARRDSELEGPDDPAD